jgi:hypothetical protein
VIAGLFEVRHGNGTPQIVGKVTDQQLIDQIDRPEDIVDDQQQNVVVVMPTYQQGIDAQDAIDDAGVSVVHTPNIIKSMPMTQKSLLSEAFSIFVDRAEAGEVRAITGGWLLRKLPRRRLSPLR